VFSILVHTDCNKRGQTSRAVAEAKIQTSCNFEANLCDCTFLLGRFYSRYSDVFSESSYNFMVWLYSYFVLCISLSPLLCKDFCDSPTSSNSSTRPCSSRRNPNIARYRKAVCSALWLQLTMVFCYLPHGIVTALWTSNESTKYLFQARQFTATLVYLNSALNPILYCWRIIEVRQAVKDTIGQFCCSWS